ncbi:unnamed protein product [Miscanthus lutarioriparius]|uniref:Uncharacterized protein n=1 Tax=Miscanthus lutarioriparius TaxID=422564 RepID=A0A811NXH8_9POAL|nr:unnamed protein product [Miscanthus lutarioriparius]
MKVTVVSRSGREVVKGGIDLKDSAKVADLQEAIHARISVFHSFISRNKELWVFTVCGVPLSFSKQESMGSLSYIELVNDLSKCHLRNIILLGSGSTSLFNLERWEASCPQSKASLSEYCEKGSGSLTVVFKDLGPQVYYSTLFFFEYLGPLIIYPMFYYLPVYKFFGYEGNGSSTLSRPMLCTTGASTTSRGIMETFFVHRFSHLTSPLSNVFRNCAYYWTFGAYIAYYCNHHCTPQ